MTDYEEPADPSVPIDFEKDPDSALDYEFLWGGKLNGDTISTSVILLPDGLTEVSSSNTDTTVQVFVSGGDCGAIYRMTNRITTVGGRSMDKTVRIRITEQ